MPEPGEMPGSYADADPQSGIGAFGVELWRSNIDDLQMKRRENGARKRDACPLLCTCVPPSPLPVGYATQLVTHIEHEENDVGLVDDFVKHEDVISAADPSSFWQREVSGSVGQTRCRCGLCELGY